MCGVWAVGAGLCLASDTSVFRCLRTSDLASAAEQSARRKAHALIRYSHTPFTSSILFVFFSSVHVPSIGSTKSLASAILFFSRFMSALGIAVCKRAPFHIKDACNCSFVSFHDTTFSFGWLLAFSSDFTTNRKRKNPSTSR